MEQGYAGLEARKFDSADQAVIVANVDTPVTVVAPLNALEAEVEP